MPLDFPFLLNSVSSSGGDKKRGGVTAVFVRLKLGRVQLALKIEIEAYFFFNEQVGPKGTYHFGSQIKKRPTVTSV